MDISGPKQPRHQGFSLSQLRKVLGTRLGALIPQKGSDDINPHKSCDGKKFPECINGDVTFKHNITNRRHFYPIPLYQESTYTAVTLKITVKLINKRNIEYIKWLDSLAVIFLASRFS